MMQRIRRMGVMQMAKTSGVLYALLGVIIGVPVVLFMSSVAKTTSGIPGVGSGVGIGTLVMMPVIYGVGGFVSGAVIAALYNLVAGWTGGIAIELE
ncbi:MAG TPA: hypothetical protein VF368_05920 [Gemmatimonadaceae bacterium]|jgi:hypothetical protein